MNPSQSARLSPGLARSTQPFPTLDHVWLTAALVLIALRPLMTPIPPHDFWWHMAVGRLIVETGAIPTVDTFSYTQAGEPFYNQGWLAQLLLYGLYRLGGVALILVIQALVLAVTYGLLLWLCIRRTGGLRLSVALLLLMTMPLSFDNWNVRPQTYAFPLFVAFLVVLTTWRLSESPRLGLLRGHSLWLLPLLMTLWVNIHGSFVLGGIMIALMVVGEVAQRFGSLIAAIMGMPTLGSIPIPVGEAEEIGLQARASDHTPRPSLRPLLFWGASSALAILINPRGVGVLGYVRNLLSSSAVTTLVTEWAPPTIRDLGGSIFFLFVLFSVAILAYTHRRPNVTDMLLAAAFFWLALGAVRNVVWFGMVMTPLLAVQLASGFRPTNAILTGAPPVKVARGLPLLNSIVMGLLLLLLLLGLPWVKPILDLPPEVGALVAADTPVAAVEYLKTTPASQRPRHLFHAMGYGSYLIWAAPAQPVFIDPRIELYPYQQWRDYLNLSAGTHRTELLREYQIDGLLLDNERQEELLKIVRADPAWEIRYQDEQTTYLILRYPNALPLNQ